MGAIELAKQFLMAMEKRDLKLAESFMAPQAEIIFPGGVRYSNQQEMVAASAGRYRWIKKRIQQTDEVRLLEATSVVYVSGTLYGEKADGLKFENIRFIDRFEICNHRIVRQDVWNDLAESGITG